MFDIRKYYEAENAKVRDSYNNTIVRIREICDETMDYQKVEKKKEYYRFFNRIGNLILKFANLEKNLNKEYFSKKTFEELQRENDEFYSELFLKNYKKNYPEPTYCVNIFSDRFGQLLSCFYIEYRQFITHTFYHKIYKMEEYNRLFIDVFDYIRNNKIEYETLKRLITAPQKKDKTNEIIFRMKEQFDIDFRYFKDIVEKADISDLRYLFSYGKFITDNEIKTAKYLLNYPKKKIKQLTNQITTAYIKGFIRDNKDITKKSTVGIIFNVGQELIIRQLIKDLKRYNLDATILGIYSSKASKQYNYDHRFDLALYLDSEYTGLIEKGYSKACKNCSDIMSIFSGLIHFGNFGKLPFTPENKKECLKLSDEQQKLFQIHQNNIMKIQDKYMPRQETSFTAISFPSPEIGENFEKIFEDILEINMLSTDKYELIQQRIIAILDKADFVHVKGRGKNKTDIIVKMQEIKNPDKETNFVNCGADINIPVGEVYTSPHLKGTNGVLHLKETYLKELKFVNLMLTFKDGYIVKYSCSNFKEEKDNKKYIEENLLFPHKTLPLGEFAIGTNTLAYVIAKRHNIMNVLPVLIIEKMGPHFAIGDTCFTMEEDKPIYNPLDKKEIIARENEKTALRKTNMKEAYTYIHTDITLPYESIEFITVITKSGEKIDIIKNGKFLLKGCEELNKPFEK